MHIQYDKITFCLKFQKEFNFGSDLTFFSSLRHANLFFSKIFQQRKRCKGELYKFRYPKVSLNRRYFLSCSALLLLQPDPHACSLRTPAMPYGMAWQESEDAGSMVGRRIRGKQFKKNNQLFFINKGTFPLQDSIYFDQVVGRVKAYLADDRKLCLKEPLATLGMKSPQQCLLPAVKNLSQCSKE